MSDLSVKDEEVVTFSEFLESVPPSTSRVVGDAFVWVSNRDVHGYYLNRPEVGIHCSHESCNGVRFFRCVDQGYIAAPEKQNKNLYMNYLCSNCRLSTKIFSIMLRDEGDEFVFTKYGEAPAYGPPIHSKLLKLIGPDRELFLKGRRCENQGLGVGAFVYYRRVVENQKNRIVDEVIKVAERVGVPQSDIDTLKASQKDFRFSSAVESIKDIMPQALLINGHNPLTLLYSALSDGLHDKTDEHCLDLASSIRVVLGELAERLSQALKDEAEINHALAKLMSIKGQKKD